MHRISIMNCTKAVDRGKKTTVDVLVGARSLEVGSYAAPSQRL